TGAEGGRAMAPLPLLAHRLRAGLAIVGHERHPEEIAELAVEVPDAALRSREQRDFHVAERGEPLDQEPQGDALADAGLAGDEREAALAGEVLAPPPKALHRRREPQRLRPHVEDPRRTP